MVGADVFDFLQPAININGQQLLHILNGHTFRTIDCVCSGHDADRGVDGLCSTFTGLEDPLQDTAVLTETGPEPLAVVGLAEPVDIENLGKLALILGSLSDVDPVLEVLTHVVATEGKHGKRVATDGTDLEVESGSGDFRTDD